MIAALPKPVQWTVDQLLGVMAKIEQNARRQGLELKTNNGRLVALDQAARRIADPTKRAAKLAAVTQLVAHQRQAIIGYRAVSARFAKLAADARNFLAAHGITRSAGLGFAPILVVGALVTVALAALAASNALDLLMNPLRKALADQERDDRALDQGSITPAEHMRRTQARKDLLAQGTKAAQAKGDPLGLTGLARSLVPVGLLALAIMVVPPMLRRGRAAA